MYLDYALRTNQIKFVETYAFARSTHACTRRMAGVRRSNLLTELLMLRKRYLWQTLGLPSPSALSLRERGLIPSPRIAYSKSASGEG